SACRGTPAPERRHVSERMGRHWRDWSSTDRAGAGERHLCRDRDARPKPAREESPARARPLMTGVASATGFLSMLTLAACTAVSTPGGGTVSTVSTDSTEAQQFFLRVAPVFQDRRCLNCHTATGFPRQG